MHKNENCHIRIYKTRQWVSKFKCMCAVNVQIDSYFFKVEIYKYCIKTSFFLTEFFFSKVLCLESLRGRIFFLLLSPWWNTPQNHPIYRMREVLTDSAHVLPVGNNLTKLLSGQVWIISMINNNNNNNNNDNNNNKLYSYFSVKVYSIM